MKIKTRRWTLAFAAVSATAALSGIGASGAQAALPGACLGTNVTGTGSSLQGAAQNIWSNGVHPVGFNGNTTSGCAGTTKPKVTYDVSSSGGCLTASGATGGVLNTAFAFCGTDDAPTAAQITTSNTASGASLLSIPVAQAAIAVVVNPPASCSVTSLTPAQVELTFRGTTTTWSSIGSGASCAAPINRVVRNDSSGTTYQLKHYLTTQNSAVVHNGLTWAGLQSSANNTTWPGTVTKSASGCGAVLVLASCTGAPGTGSGGGDEVRTVAVTSGSIGYAALSDARSVTTARLGLDTNTGGLKWVKVGATALTAVDPSSNGVSTTKANSNCTTAGAAYGTPGSATGDWSGSYLTTAGSNYPICTLTWDLAYNNYTTTKWGADSNRIAQTVRDYLHYILLGGQTDINNNDYAALPTDVKSVATTGVTEITG